MRTADVVNVTDALVAVGAMWVAASGVACRMEDRGKELLQVSMR